MPKLYSQPDPFISGDVPLEDPNHLGNPDEYTDDIIEYLEHFSENIEQDARRRSALDKLITATESLQQTRQLTPETLQLLILAKNHVMGGVGINERKVSLESLREGSINIHATYAVEGFMENLQSIELSLREKYKKLWEKAVYFYENVLRRNGRIKNRVLKLEGKVGDGDGYKTRPTIEMKQKDVLLVPRPNTSSGIHSLTSAIKSGHYNGEAGDNLKKSLLSLKGYSLKTINGMEQMLTRMPEDPLDEISRGIISDGFELQSGSSQEEEGKPGTRVFYSKHGMLGSIFIILTVHYTGDRQITGVNVNYSVGKVNKVFKNTTVDIPVLDTKEQKEVLAAVGELNSAVDSYGEDKKKIRILNQEREKELFRLLSELEKNKEMLRKADNVGYKHISKYLHSLFNSLIVTESPMIIFTSSALDICDKTLDYVDKSIRVTKGFHL